MSNLLATIRRDVLPALFTIAVAIVIGIVGFEIVLGVYHLTHNTALTILVGVVLVGVVLFGSIIIAVERTARRAPPDGR